MSNGLKNIRGFTLVEIMVAVTIGLIVLAAVAQIFATSRATYSLEENLARVQENGRFAMEFLTRDIRMAGYAGCVNVNQALNASANYTATNGLNNPTDFANAFAPQVHIQGHEWTSANTWTPALPAFLAGQVLDGTDVIVVRRGSETAHRLDGVMADPTAAITIREPNDIDANDIVLVGDCSNVDVVKVTGVSTTSGVESLAHAAANPGNVTNGLSKAFETDAEVMKLITRVYFIGNNANGVPTLYAWDMDDGQMTNNTTFRLELIPNIESMHVLYGEDTD
ncbi:MAG: prepilin-type N-terminal cleavage/methylation domain-containing protein, partial [Xanthomonadales bacterium]|nr:prepilin-type N-terminal cleavage/methylation domain-containing protein [Xanthomonadales bacterium]